MSKILTRIQISTTELFIPKFLKMDTTVFTTNGDIYEAIKEIDFAELNLTNDNDIIFARVRHEDTNGPTETYTDWSDTRAIYRTQLYDKFMMGICIKYKYNQPTEIFRINYKFERIDNKDVHLASNWIFRDNFQLVKVKESITKGKSKSVNKSDLNLPENYQVTTDPLVFDKIVEEYIKFKPLYFRYLPYGVSDTDSEGYKTILLSAAPVNLPSPVEAGLVIKINHPIGSFICGNADNNTIYEFSSHKMKPILIGRYPSTRVSVLLPDPDDSSKVRINTKSVSTKVNMSSSGTTIVSKSEFLNNNTNKLKETDIYQIELDKESDVLEGNKLFNHVFLSTFDKYTAPFKMCLSIRELTLFHFLYLFVMGEDFFKSPTELIPVKNPDNTVETKQRWEALIGEDFTKSIFGVKWDMSLPTPFIGSRFNSDTVCNVGRNYKGKIEVGIGNNNAVKSFEFRINEFVASHYPQEAYPIHHTLRRVYYSLPFLLLDGNTNIRLFLETPVQLQKPPAYPSNITTKYEYNWLKGKIHFLPCIDASDNDGPVDERTRFYSFGFCNQPNGFWTEKDNILNVMMRPQDGGYHNGNPSSVKHLDHLMRRVLMLEYDKEWRLYNNTFTQEEIDDLKSKSEQYRPKPEILETIKYPNYLDD